ncbi:hypothetical protein [Verrucomicrobium sp. BvORR106]|uniref:hypothetical protein n=1 Tax=Verrucomicrobium sp. BvORR106 TaxID=1403819 RepID=UPI00056F2B36|nr:hypothetical protein [Verrucomicrobium sp. BvORR106]
MNSQPSNEAFRETRWLVCALLSAKVKEPDQLLAVMEASVISRGGTVAGRLLQRRGASRSNRPGGTKRMELPLTQRTLFGSGKTAELIALAHSTKATHLLVYNSLTDGQKRTLADSTGTIVHSFLDDPPFSESAFPP